MRFYLFLILIFSVFISCSETNQQEAVGVESFSDLLEIAKSIHKSGDVDLLFRHTDVSGVSSETLESTRNTLESWPGMSPKMKVKSIKVVSPANYDPHAAIPKEWSKEFKERFKASTIESWNIEPEKYIIITEEPKTIESKLDKETFNRIVFGTFSKNGLWYFSYGM